MLKTEDGGDTQASAGKAGGMKNLRQACLKEKKKSSFRQHVSPLQVPARSLVLLQRSKPRSTVEKTPLPSCPHIWKCIPLSASS